MEKYQSDILWCINECQRLNIKVWDEGKVEAFAERVTVKCADGVPEKEARKQAFNEQIS